MPRVVIVGAGFAGLQCARALDRDPFEVVLLDRNNYHLFTPLLYQVASALVNPSDIAYPVRAVFTPGGRVRFRTATVTGVAFDRGEVLVADGRPEPYDRLVLATGAEINFFGNDDMAAAAHTLITLPGAITLRNHVLTRFEAAAASTHPAVRRRELTFVVVGAGPTGVEYAGALAELVRLVARRDFREFSRSDVRIILVEGADRVLPPFAPSLGGHAREVLQRMGVEVRLGTFVRTAAEASVRLDTGEEIETATLVWAAGVRPGALTRGLDLPRRSSGRVAVDAFLRVDGRPDVFAIGDAAGVLDGEDELPMLATPAMQQGRHVARQLRREQRGKPLQPFRYRDKGTMATIGRNAGVAQMGKLKLKGVVGWVAWLAVHLYFIIGFRNRVAVLLRWAWEYVFYDRPIRFVIGGRRRRRPD